MASLLTAPRMAMAAALLLALALASSGMVSRALLINLGQLTVARASLSPGAPPERLARADALLGAAVAMGAAPARVGLARAYLEMARGETEAAEALLDGLLAGTLQARFAYARMGDEALRRSDFEGAAEAWLKAGVARERSVTSFYSGAEAQGQRRWSRAAAYYDLAARLDPGFALAWRKLAEARSEEGNTAAAIAALEKLDARGLAEYEDYVTLGRLWTSSVQSGSDQGALDRARNWFLRAASLEPSRPEPQVGLVQVALKQGSLAEAAERSVGLVDRFPSCADCLFAAGTAFLQSQQYSKAATALEKALAVRPDDAWTHDVLGQALAVTDQTEAERHLLRAVELEPGVVPHVVHLGDFYLHGDKKDLAAQTYVRALSLGPEKPDQEYIVQRLQQLGATR